MSIESQASPPSEKLVSNKAPSTIGSRLRARRTALRFTLAEVAKGAGISEGFLSQVERDRANASIATLQRLADQLRVMVSELFSDPETSSVHRLQDAELREYGTGARKVLITPTSNTQLQSFYGEFEPYGETGPEALAHGDSEEYIFVIEGFVEVTVGEVKHRLQAGDGVAYQSGTPHRIREVAGQSARCIWMMAPSNI